MNQSECQDRLNRRISYQNRLLFLEEYNAKELNPERRPLTICHWRCNLANKTSSIGDFTRFIDHTEVFKIKHGRGYIHVTSPYKHVENLNEEFFMTQLGYKKSKYRIYNPDAITYYKVITCLTMLRREMDNLGYQRR